MAKTPKATSTRLSLPLGIAGSEPDSAPVGSLAYATDTEQVRVRKAGGWDDVGGGGGGTITEVDGTNGIAATNPTGPVVSLAPTYGSTANTVCQGNDSRLSDSRTPSGSAGGDLSGTYPNPNVAAIHETSGPTKLTFGSISAGQLLVRSGATVIGQSGAAPTGSAGGDLSGTYPNPNVAAIHETSGPTQLTFGSISSGQVLVRSGTTVVGQTGAAPTGSAGGDLSGTYPNPTVAAIHETSGPTQLTFGSITAGQLLVRSGTTVVGQTGAAPTGSAGGDLSGTYPNPNVAAIHETSGPTQLTFGAIAAGATLVRSGSTIVGATFDRPGQPYLSKPASPDAWNLEARDLTNPDLAANGWTITLLDSPWTTQTRAGNLGTAMAANQYNSELISGVLGLQFPAGVSVVIYKAITNAPFTYKARSWHTSISTSTGSLVGVATGVQRKTTGIKSYVTGIDGTTGSGATQMVEFFLTGPSTFNFVTNATMLDNGLDSCKYVDFTNSGGGNEQVRHQDAINGRSLLAPGSRLTTIAPTHFVAWFYSNNDSPFWIDFFRRTPYLSNP